MSNHPYLIFTVHHSLYALEALMVQEIFFLPAFTKIVECSPDIVGVINLRGDIIPILDLNRRFGYPPPQYQLTDSIIILSWKQIKFGLIVNEVHEVKIINSGQISSDLLQKIDQNQEVSNQINLSKKPKFVAGFAQVDTEIIILLNPDQLVHCLQEQSWEDYDQQVGILEQDRGSETVISGFSQDAKEQEIFQQRAHNLMLQTKREDFSGLIPLSVVGLNGEYFGLNLEVVREFTDVRKVTPVPCTPPHIVGNMNLRGEILTLIDIRGILNMSMNPGENLPGLNNMKMKAMIIEVEGLVAGIVLDEVFDVMYLQQSDLKSIPTIIHSKYEEYLRATAPYNDKIMGILDLPKILTQGRLIVDEEVVSV